MGQKIKKGTVGLGSKFVTRSKAIKKLDLPIRDFRKLCIYKGVFPRVPPNSLKRGAHRTYYHIKDLKFLEQDKLMDHFRQLNAYRKKMKTAIVGRDDQRIKQLKKLRPRLNIDHVVRERYPSFALALGDLDDPLTLLSLIASVPSHRLFKLSPERISIATRLIGMFKAIVSEKRLLRKVFLSAKGVYYQAEINGQPITWVEPYAFSSVLPFDVDYKVILSFTEFYLVLVKFVLFKLFATQGYRFPGLFTPEISYRNTLGSCVLEKNAGSVEQEAEMDPNFAQELQQRGQSPASRGRNSNLFENLVFFLSREVDKKIFEFVIKSNGGRVVWDDANFDSETYRSAEITHVVMDRPLLDEVIIQGREYIQPQWLCDSANFGIQAPYAEYRPGLQLPPHVSPFVDDKAEGYVPERKRQLLELANEYIEEDIVSESDAEAREEELEVAPVQRAQPVIAVPDKKKPSTIEKKSHGKFDASAKPEYKVKKVVFSAAEEAIESKKEGSKKEKEQAQLQAMAMNRKRKRMLDHIIKEDKVKADRAAELRRNAKNLKSQK